jgi:hypothetical protein
LKASKKAARQNIIKSVYFRKGESFGGRLPSTSVSVGDRGEDSILSKKHDRDAINNAGMCRTQGESLQKEMPIFMAG